jgi:hypothetical protein
MAAATLAADVLPAFDDASVLERAPEHLFERRVPAQHPAAQQPGNSRLRSIRGLERFQRVAPRF